MVNESANVKITLNGDQAQQELETLQSEMKRLLDLKKKAETAGDVAGWKQIDDQLKKNVKTQNQLKKNYADIENTLRNLNGASLNDLTKAKNVLLQRLKSLNQGTKEWIATNNDLQKVKSKITEVGQAMGTVQTPLQKVIGIAKGLLPAFGLTALVAGAKAAFTQVINSTDTLSTQWAIFTGGLKSGLDEFWRTMASGSWENFFGNMRTAIAVGREYERVLDELEAKQRGLTKAEADARMEMRQLEDIVRNVSLSNEERVAAAEKRIKLEEKLTKQRTDLAKKEYDNELSLAIQSSKLDEKRLLEQIDAKSVETELHAKTLLELRERYAELERANQVVVGGVRVNGPSTTEMQQLKTEMATYPSFIVEYANNMEKIGNTTDEQLNRLITAYDKLKGAEASALENTKRVRSAMYSIFDEEKRNANAGNNNKSANALHEELDLSAFLGASIEKQQEIINDYFSKAGEGAFDAFLDAIEKSQNEKKIDFSILPEMPDEKEAKDISQDPAILKYKETAEFKRALALSQYEQEIIDSIEYQERLTEIDKEAEDKRNEYKLLITETSLEAINSMVGAAASYFQAKKDEELEAAAGNAEQQNEIRRKYAKKEQNIAVAQALIGGALSVMRILSGQGTGNFIVDGILKAIMIAATVVTTGLQIATIKSQSFAKGGFTNPGGYTNGPQMYEAGEAGTEWIAPNWMTKDPETAAIIAGLEEKRKNPRANIDGVNSNPLTINFKAVPQFNTGGFTSAPSKTYVDTPTSITKEIKLINENNTAAIIQLQNAINKLTDLKIYASIEDIRKADKNYTEIQNTRGL